MATFSSADVGYLCQSPESTIKNAILAAKLPQHYNVVGTLSLDVATGECVENGGVNRTNNREKRVAFVPRMKPLERLTSAVQAWRSSRTRCPTRTAWR